MCSEYYDSWDVIESYDAYRQRVARDTEDLEQAKAIKGITNAGQTLKYSLQRTEFPVENTGPNSIPEERMYRAYRQYYVMDLFEDVCNAFLRYKSNLDFALRRFKPNDPVVMRVDIRLNEKHDLCMSLVAERYANVQTGKDEYVLAHRDLDRIEQLALKEVGDYPIYILDISFMLGNKVI